MERVAKQLEEAITNNDEQKAITILNQHNILLNEYYVCSSFFSAEKIYC